MAQRSASLRRLDTALTVVFGALATLSLMMLAVPDFRGHIEAHALDLVIDTIALVVTSAVSALTWIRYRERHESVALARSVAFLALAIADANAIVTAVLADLEAVTSASVSQGQLFVWTAARLLAAGLLTVGGIEAVRGRTTRRAAPLVLGAWAYMLLVLAAVRVLGEPLTSLLSSVTSQPGRPASIDLSLTTAGVAATLLCAALFLAAVVVGRRAWRRDRGVGDAYLVVGLVIAAFAELHLALFPSAHPQQIGTTELLQLAFYTVLFLGIQGEARSMMSSLRVANESLARLRDAEVERAALEERARLSRELHDGLAQNLWLANLKIGRLASSPDLSQDDRALAEEATKAVEMSLTEARQGVIALRETADPQATFADLIARYVDDTVDRFGVPVACDCDRRLPRLPPRTAAELLRILQEALSNAVRHSGGRRIAVQARSEASRLILVIEDDGRGIAPGAVAEGHVGLRVMQERAASIGARLTVGGRDGGGTRVLVEVPLAAGA